MADARTTLSGQGIAVGGGYGSSSRRDPSGHERVQAQRAEANVREQEARRLGTWKEGVGVINKQQLAAEARDKALWEQNRAAQNQTSMATPSFQDRQQNAMISAVQEARNAQQMRPETPRPFMGVTTGYVPENRSGVPGASRSADPTQGVVPIAPQYQVSGKSPFGYAGTPEYKTGQMVRAIDGPINNWAGRQTGVAGATRNNWQQAVMAAHPEIGQKGSEFNKRYVQAVKAQTGEFDPMKLAEQVSKTLPSSNKFNIPAGQAFNPSNINLGDINVNAQPNLLPNQVKIGNTLIDANKTGGTMPDMEIARSSVFGAKPLPSTQIPKEGVLLAQASMPKPVVQQLPKTETSGLLGVPKGLPSSINVDASTPPLLTLPNAPMSPITVPESFSGKDMIINSVVEPKQPTIPSKKPALNSEQLRNVQEGLTRQRS